MTTKKFSGGVLIPFFVILSFTIFHSMNCEQECKGWNYNVKDSIKGPNEWSHFCGEGNEACNSQYKDNLQSPIDIKTKDVSRVHQGTVVNMLLTGNNNQIQNHLDAITFSTFQFTQLTVSFTGNVIRADIPQSSNPFATVKLSNAFIGPHLDKLTITRFNYQISHLLIHSRSEHAIDGKYSDIELQLVANLVTQDNLPLGIPSTAIISVMLRGVASKDSKRGHFNRGFAKFTDAITKIQNGSTTTAEISQLSYLDYLIPRGTVFPLMPGYYHYIGSLSTPPCTTNVAWYVYTDPVMIADSQRDAILNFTQVQSNYLPNSRPVQQRLNRRVFQWRWDPRYRKVEMPAKWRILLIIVLLSITAVVSSVTIVREEILRFVYSVRVKHTRSSYETL